MSGFYQPVPKVELHRHLEGSLRLQTMLEIARVHGITVPFGTGQLRSLVQVQQSDPYTYQNFLAKFNTLRLFYRSPEVIYRVTREAIEDAARDNVRYLELRFTPVALSRAERFPLDDVMDWVCDSARKAAQEFGLRVGLIASVNRHESVELAEQVAWLAAERREQGIFGLDLAGNEAEFPAEPFLGVFREAKQAGLHITMHAGEWGGPENVRTAIEIFEAERIGHGVHVMEDPAAVLLARERGVTFEVCLTSNHQSGVFKHIAEHPLMRMIAAGLKVALCTDDPSISQITLSHEYYLACEQLGMTQRRLKETILTAAQASFLPEDEKAPLIAALRQELGL